jgi:hypothetical protein
MSIASSRKDVRSAALSIIASLVEMVHTSDAFETFRLPVDGYQTLVLETRGVATLSTGHSVLKNSLQVILTETEGASQAWEGLFAYFCSLC